MFTYVPAFIPDIVQVAPFALAFAILCAKPLRAHPNAFYIPITLIVVAVSFPDLISFECGGNPPAFVTAYANQLQALRSSIPLLDDVLELLTSAVTGVFLYFIVMFIGAMRKTPTVKKLYTVRGELSVIAGIIIMGHVCRIIAFPFYFANDQFMNVWGQPAGYFMFAAAVIVGIPLTLTFLLPWITSFKCIRRHMKPKTWKNVQKLAYVMMALMVLQGVFLGIGHAMFGYPYTDQTALYRLMMSPADTIASIVKAATQAWIYAAIGVTYLVMRVSKACADKKARLEKAEAPSGTAETAEATEVAEPAETA